MKKSNFAALILTTISGIFFALGVCMVLLPEWGVRNQGIVCGLIGLVLALITFLIWRRMESKDPIRISKKMIGATLISVLGALLLGVGMCLCMLFSSFIFGIVIGITGIVVLLMLIPLLKGLHD